MDTSEKSGLVKDANSGYNIESDFAPPNGDDSGWPKMFCVLWVDLENSTSITAGMRPDGYKRYYSSFYGAISTIAKQFGATTMKYVGDALLFYFPATSDPANRSAFIDVLRCGMSIVESRCSINSTLHSEGLPSISFRMSADYGRMEIIETSDSPTLDFVSPSMNMVSKMNHLAPSNGMVIGGDLHQAVAKFATDLFSFVPVGHVDIGMKLLYPVYGVVIERKIQSGIKKSAMLGIDSMSCKIRKEGAAPNIMIVDDEPDILLTYNEFLSKEGYNIEPFSNPREALNRLLELGPMYYDLAILDIRMPEINGLQLYQSLKSFSSKINIILVTGLDAAQELVTLVRGISADDIMKKPVEKQVLVRAVKSRLGKQAV
jgi:CheY-like chemotaxis protein